MKQIAIILFSICISTHVDSQTKSFPEKDIDKLVYISNSNYDMGKIRAGIPLQYNLVIKNISKDTLILQDVKAGCGCTTPRFRAGEKLVPGKSTFIALGFNGDAHGEFTKTAEIFFNDGLSKQVKFHGVTFTDSSTAKAPM